MKAILFDLDGVIGGYGVGNGLYLQKARGQLAERYPHLDFGDDKSFLDRYRKWEVSCWGAWAKKELLLERKQVGAYVFEQLLKQHGLEDDVAQAIAAELQAEMVAEFPEAWRPAEGIVEVLTWAKQTGAVLGVLSNGHVEEQTGKLRDHGVLDFFDHLFFSSEVGFAKPDVRIFEHALRTCGVEASDALMIGDSYTNDLEPAERLGMARIWVYTDAKILGLPDDRAVADVRDIPNLVGAMQK